jgi:hypothetical protein
MSNYQSRDSQVLARQLKVQRLVIPFKIVGNATASAVAISRDEPSLLFLKTGGVDQITPALSSTDTAPTIAQTPSDSSGTFNLLVKINEPVAKVMGARVVRTDVANKQYQCQLENSGSGVVVDTALSADGDKLIVSCVGDLALNTSNTFNGTLECEYVVDQSVDPTALFS